MIGLSIITLLSALRKAEILATVDCPMNKTIKEYKRQADLFADGVLLKYAKDVLLEDNMEKIAAVRPIMRKLLKEHCDKELD